MGTYHTFYKIDEQSNFKEFNSNKYAEIHWLEFMNDMEIDKVKFIERVNLTHNQLLSFKYSENPIIEIKREDLYLFEDEFIGMANRFLFRELMDEEKIDVMYWELDF